MSHVVKTIKIKRGAKMHVLANGAGRNLRSTIMNHLNIRIMSTLRIKCLDMCEVESIIADAQEILSHVEFGSLNNGVLTLFCVA